MRLTWTPKGIRGRTRQNEPDKNWRRVSIRGAQKGYEVTLESDTETVTVLRANKRDKKREVQPRGRHQV